MPASAPAPQTFDTTDLDMIRRGDFLGPELGERVYAALVSASDARKVGIEVKPEINDAMTILGRLAEGDSIAFSRDGDNAWFVKGDRAWVGDAIIDLRAKGYINRVYEDDDDWGRDTISDLGIRALGSGK
jgi:hypothetical protein